jgi:hypothetical protein
MFEGLIYILVRLREEVLRTFYDGPVRGHPGIAKFMQMLKESYYFPRIRHTVEEYVRKCTIYRRNKHDRHTLYGLLQLL